MRPERVGARIQQEVADYFRAERVHPELGMVTIQEVRVSRDLTQATIYFSCLGGSMAPQDATRWLNQHGAALRHVLAPRLNLRLVPQIHFKYDVSLETGNRVSALIDAAVRRDRAAHPLDDTTDEGQGRGEAT